MSSSLLALRWDVPITTEWTLSLPPNLLRTAQLVSVPALALLGFTLAVTGLGVPLAAVLTDRPNHFIAVKERHGSRGSFTVTLSRADQSDR